MTLLILVHVLSAILGLGPAFAFPFMLRPASTAKEMKDCLAAVSRLEFFPKVFGTIAILSGLVLFFIGSYGPFMQLWISGTLAVYVIVEVIIVAMLNPAAKKLTEQLAAEERKLFDQDFAALVPVYGKVRNLHTWASVLCLLILILMIVKP